MSHRPKNRTGIGDVLFFIIYLTLSHSLILEVSMIYVYDLLNSYYSFNFKFETEIDNILNHSSRFRTSVTMAVSFHYQNFCIDCILIVLHTTTRYKVIISNTVQ